MGTIINNHPEYPLHFLQGEGLRWKKNNLTIFSGVWGSAFSILIHRGKDLKTLCMFYFNTRLIQKNTSVKKVGNRFFLLKKLPIKPITGTKTA